MTRVSHQVIVQELEERDDCSCCRVEAGLVRSPHDNDLLTREVPSCVSSRLRGQQTLCSGNADLHGHTS